MANWVKYLKDLPQDPAVILICSRTKMNCDTVCGKLMRLWSWADTNTVDGFVPNVTQVWIDKFVCRVGFAAAMVDAGWLVFENGGVTFPRFDRHNGNSAKKRADDAERQRLSRANRGQNVTDLSQNSVTNVTNSCDKSVTRQDKTRQDKSREDLLDSSNNPQALLASLPDKRQMLTMLRVVNPALDLICDCEELTPEILDREYRAAKRGKGVKDATGVFVASVCKIGGITLPKRGAASVGRALALAMPIEDQEKAKAFQAMARSRRGAG